MDSCYIKYTLMKLHNFLVNINYRKLSYIVDTYTTGLVLDLTPIKSTFY